MRHLTLLLGLLLFGPWPPARGQGPQQAQALDKPAARESRPDVPAPDFELPRVFEPGAFRLSAAWSEGHVLIVFVRGMW